MSLAPARPATMRGRGRWWAGCCLAAALVAIGAPPAARAERPAPVEPLLAAGNLDHEPPVVRDLLQRAGRLESAPDVADGSWQAASLYCVAARAGSAEAQYRLGMLHAFGQGVPTNRAYAAALFSLAASLGHAQAAQMLEAVQLTSSALPACVESDQPPERVAPPAPDLQTSPPIDQFVQKLPRNKRWVVPLATTLSAWYELDPRLVLSVIAVESNFESAARSPKAAAGLMQLIPATAERFNVRDAFDATQNLRGGMRYLRWLLSYYRGNVAYALAAYNAGEGRVDRHRGVPPIAETRAYVQRVIGLYGGRQHSFAEGLATAPSWLRARSP